MKKGTATSGLMEKCDYTYTVDIMDTATTGLMEKCGIAYREHIILNLQQLSFKQQNDIIFISIILHCPYYF